MLTIDESKVKQAAKDCPQAKKVLETLFPEVFKETEFIASEIGGDPGLKTVSGEYILSASRYNKGDIHLSDRYEWKIIGDYLIPTKK